MPSTVPGLCANCGAPLAETRSGALCPVCLLREGLRAGPPADPVSTLPCRFGAYELLEELGRGGMGVVYRARQPSLDRLVALKVSTVDAEGDDESSQRFRIEAAAAARLHHSNIVAIHDFGEVDGRPFYVMDLVAGRDLAVLCGGRPLEPRRVATLLRKIAHAVHYAHLAGVLHRDLKPSNVIVDDADEPHVTDFGLAKRMERPEGATVAGQVLGSPGYASPEQVAGRTGEVGVPSDIYSLGALGYHLATGRAPFEGSSAADTLRAMLAGIPKAPRELNPKVPRDLERIILTCLQSDPARRYASAAAVATELDRFLMGQAIEGSVVPRRFPTTRLLLLGAAGVLAILVAASGVWRTVMPPAVPIRSSVVHATIDLPAEAPFAPSRVLPLGSRSAGVAISADGTQIVYVAQVRESTQLYLRALDDVRAHPVADTTGAYLVDFSPDGQWLAYAVPGKLRKVSTRGGAAVTLSDVSDDSWGLAWAADDRIYVNSRSALLSTPAAGGQLEEVPKIFTRGITAAEDRKGLFGCFQDSNAGLGDYRAIQRFDLQTQSIDDLGTPGYAARALPGRALVFARGNGLFATRLGDDGRAVRGEPVPVLDRVQVDGVNIVAQYAVSETGALVYVEGEPLDRVRIVEVNRRGETRVLPVAPQSLGSLEISPDGRQLAIRLCEETRRVLLVEIATGNARVLIGSGQMAEPVWSLDGTELFFVGRREDRPCIMARSLTDLARPPRLLFEAPAEVTRLSLTDSLSDSALLVRTIGPGRTMKTLVVDVDGPEPPRVLPDARGGFLQISPDGRWAAMMATLSIRSEIYVQRFPDGPLIQVSFSGGEEPRWSERGDELYYRYGDVWYAVSVGFDPDFSASPPRELFRGPYRNVPGFSYAVAPDGERFFVLQSEVPEEPVDRLHLVLNWADEVQRRLARQR